MSKLATLRQYRYSPMAGGPFSFIGKALKGVVGFVKGGIGALTKSKTAQVIAQNLPAAKDVAKYVGPLAAGAALGALTSGGGGGGGASGGWSGSRRRGKGITARELRGFRKVSNLLHREGMVARRAHKGRSH